MSDFVLILIKISQYLHCLNYAVTRDTIFLIQYQLLKS